jgi:hypothetical protein
MGLYNFKRRFALQILCGQKTLTIRAPRKVEDVPGNTVHLYCGLRTASCELLLRAPYLKNEPIIIEPPSGLVELAGVRLNDDERHLFAVADGFKSFLDMAEFWKGQTLFKGLVHYWRFPHKTSSVSAATAAKGRRHSNVRHPGQKGSR